jgi:hypothetical protein
MAKPADETDTLPGHRVAIRILGRPIGLERWFDLAVCRPKSRHAADVAEMRQK